MRKKFLGLFLSVLVLSLCLFGLVACKNRPFYGTYSDTTTEFVISRKDVKINGESRNYKIVNNKLRIDGYMGDLSFYEDYNVLSFDVILSFDSGSITQRETYFNANLYNYDNSGFLYGYNFYEDGTMRYYNSAYVTLNASGTYIVKNGVIKITQTDITNKTSKVNWYISTDGQIHYGVYLKDGDDFFKERKCEEHRGFTEGKVCRSCGLKCTQTSKYYTDFEYVIMESQEEGISRGEFYSEVTPNGLGGRFNEIYISSDVKVICNSAFAGSSIEELIIPDSVTTIGDSAFSGCKNLKNFKIPNSVTRIGDNAFSMCESLTSINIPDSVVSLGKDAFDCCYNLRSATIGNGVENIETYTFGRCYNLMNITIGEKVETVHPWAFIACWKLVEVYNKSALSIEELNFPNDDDIEVFSEYQPSKLSIDEQGYIIYKNGKEKVLVNYLGKQERLVLPEDITKIHHYAFRGELDSVKKIKSIKIPNGVEYIEYYPFDACKQLQSLIIPESIKGVYWWGLPRHDINIFYEGSIDKWIEMNLDEGMQPNHVTYFYSEEEPALNAEQTSYDGNYFKYDNGEIEIWTYSK